MINQNHNPTALIVEPAAAVREQLRQRLTALGYAVMTVASPDEADRLLDEADVIVASTRLPGESGWLWGSKLRLVRPESRIVLHGPAPADEHLASHVTGLMYLVDGAELETGLPQCLADAPVGALPCLA